jgi:RNA polymerase sigma-70 factor (ECF subfamily)
MSSPPLDDLLEKLCRGDARAAEQVFLTYEPYLRMVVRRRLPAALRARFDSVDVVQSVWADLVQGFRQAGWRFPNAAALQAFLVKVTHNRFLDRVRRHQPSLEREHAVSLAEAADRSPSPLPRPSEVAEADDLWERMLALCPPAHHEVLRLKRQGLPLAEVAARTGLHEGSIRRILRTLARRLALQQAAAPGDAPRAWQTGGAP